MKLSTLSFLLLFSASSAFALHEGGFDGGGGDPLALDFLTQASALQRAQASNQIDLGVSASTLLVKIEEIRASLEGQSPLIEFPAGKTVNCFGVEKLGCVENSGRVRIARQGWQEATPRERTQLVAMEITKAANGKNRYAVAESVDRILAQKASFSLGEQTGNTKRPVKPEPIFIDCRMNAINDAIYANNKAPEISYPTYEYRGKPVFYPQFDYVANDGLENAHSFTYYDNNDPNYFYEDKESDDQKAGDQRPSVEDDLRKDVTIVSWLQATPGQMRSSWGPLDVITKQDERAFVSAYILHQDEDDNDRSYSCYHEALRRTTLGSALAIEKALAQGQKLDSWEQELPAKFRAATTRPANSRLAFEPCVREALNTAFRRAAHDEAYINLTGGAPNSYKLESAYRLQPKGPQGQEDLLINLKVNNYTMELPLSYRLVGRENADGTCTVLDVRDR